ncbi:MAG: hypothetical protein AAFX50_16275 [Acidobacteriota bacterium]
MSEPEYLICLDCESPCYTFEWRKGKLFEAMCLTCGADDVDQFVSEEDFEAIVSSDH